MSVAAAKNNAWRMVFQLADVLNELNASDDDLQFEFILGLMRRVVYRTVLAGAVKMAVYCKTCFWEHLEHPILATET